MEELQGSCSIGAGGNPAGELDGSCRIGAGGNRVEELDGGCTVGEGGNNRRHGGIDPCLYGCISYFKLFVSGVLIEQGPT